MFLTASLWSTESVDPAFWVNVAIAVGTIGAVVTAVVLGLGAYNKDKARQTIEVELELRREAELQAVSIRITRSGSVNVGTFFNHSVRIINGSGRPIYSARVGIIERGERVWSNTAHEVVPAGADVGDFVSST